MSADRDWTDKAEPPQQKKTLGRLTLFVSFLRPGLTSGGRANPPVKLMFESGMGPVGRVQVLHVH